MYIKNLFAPVLLITMLLGGGLLFLPGQAFAVCCGCGNCWMMYVYGSQYCYCGGNCPTCSTDDFDPARLNVVINNGMLENISTSKNLRFTAQRFDVYRETLSLMSGGSKCFRAKIALSLLGTAGEKFVPIRFD